MNFSPPVEEINAGVLVIGGGLAGLTAAIEASRITDNVVLVTRGKAGQSGNTIMARNGIAAVLEEGRGGDSAPRHAEDTLAAGCYINHTGMVEYFTRNAGPAVKRLMELGVPFMEENGEPVRKGAPGHSCRRFLSVSGSSIKASRTRGLALTLPLAREAQKAGVKHVNNVVITGLLTAGGRIAGACGLDEKEKRMWLFKAPAVILACGGAGGLYPVSTNTAGINGDGYALALSAGARLRDMEFVQFHPAFALGQSRMVMSTAPFADGAVLRNKDGKRYMERYAPQKEMATRDVMARANYTEIAAGRGTGNGGVLLDFSAVPDSIMQGRYSDLYNYLQGEKTVEVAPAMHFMMGGVEVDENGRTGLPGLYAAGETAGGLHGANRLAGNALAEAAVFGMAAGRHAANFSRAAQPAAGNLPRLERPAGTGSSKLTSAEIRKKTKKIMGDKVALVRNDKGLQSARDEIAQLQEELENININSWKEWIDYHKTRLITRAASAITEAALARKESLGTHYRED